MKTLFIFMMLVALFPIAAGCAGPSKELSGAPEYQQGYGDGCATGSAYSRNLPGSVTRDAQLYENNDAYAAGWRAGFGACRPALADPLAL